MIPKIIKHMSEVPHADQRGTVFGYGEFFPPSLSPLAYNESIALEYAPRTAEEARKEGYQWAEPEKKEHQATVTEDELPQDIEKVEDSILKQVIRCAHEGTCAHSCVTAFKIIPQELTFYRQHGIPLPRLCFACRHHERRKLVYSQELTHQKCRCGGEKSLQGEYKNATGHFHESKPCPNEFETSKSEREIVYCEQCYQAEVL